MIRVFIADDHTIVRQGLRRLIEEQPDMAVAGEAATGWQVLDAAGAVPWDVLLLDLSLPGVSGIEVLRRLRQTGVPSRVVVLSAYPEEQYAVHAVREGAAAYLPKERGDQELLQAIRTVAGGGSHLSATVLDQLRGGSDLLPHQRLSAREYQVFMLLIQGRTVSEIAAELDITVSTTSNHVAHVKEKLGTRTLGETINYAHRAGLVGDA